MLKCLRKYKDGFTDAELFVLVFSVSGWTMIIGGVAGLLGLFN